MEKNRIVYRDISFEEVSLIKDFWERNRDYHQKISKSFGNLYHNLKFEDRISGFASFDKDNIKMTLAEDKKTQKCLAYCISVIEAACGETQTLHVIEDARRFGIGKQLMLDHMQWFKENACLEVKLLVSYDNEKTIAFYESLGFISNTIEMRLKG